MSEQRIGETDILVALDVIDSLPKDGRSDGIRATFLKAKKVSINPGGEVRLVELPKADATWLLEHVQGSLKHGKPSEQKTSSLNRLVAHLHAMMK
jgi:uncharacterized protein YabE (DUF348 family)